MFSCYRKWWVSLIETHVRLKMPRIFHAGIKGSFMDNKTHLAYFARIATNLDAGFRWTTDMSEGTTECFP
jgi:hypothetical protein